MAARHVVVDGSNLATEGRSMPSLAQLDQAVREFLLENPDDVVTVVVDASFGHRIDAGEFKVFEEAETAGELVSPPAGAIGRGDAFLLRIADKTGATVLSNDSFQEFHGDYDWLFERGRLIGGKPVPGVGWIFTPRTPVRGPRSREAVKEAKRKTKGEPESAIPGLDLAAERSRTKGKGKKNVERAIAVALEEAVAPKDKPHRRRKGGSPPADPVNDPLSFITFIAAHPLGAEVTATVESFASHGAFVDCGGARCYVPLSAMGNPPPKSAREMFTKGEEVRFVVQALDPQRRGVELAVPGFAKIAGAPTDETVAAEIEGRAEDEGEAAGGAAAAAAGASLAVAPGRRTRKKAPPASEPGAPEAGASEAGASEVGEEAASSEAPPAVKKAAPRRRGARVSSGQPVEVVTEEPLAAGSVPHEPAAAARAPRRRGPRVSSEQPVGVAAAEPVASEPTSGRRAPRRRGSTAEPGDSVESGEPAAQPAPATSRRRGSRVTPAAAVEVGGAEPAPLESPPGRRAPRRRPSAPSEPERPVPAEKAALRRRRAPAAATERATATEAPATGAPSARRRAAAASGSAASNEPEAAPAAGPAKKRSPAPRPAGGDRLVDGASPQAAGGEGTASRGSGGTRRGARAAPGPSEPATDAVAAPPAAPASDGAASVTRTRRRSATPQPPSTEPSEPSEPSPRRRRGTRAPASESSPGSGTIPT